MEAILQAKEISKTYHTGSVDVPALKQCSLEFGKGEFTAIIGKSGSGKSTLLRILGSMDTPDTGSILIKGEDITHMKDKKLSGFRRRNIGFIYQDYSLFPEFTAYENIVVPFALDNKNAPEEEIDGILESLGISHCKGKYPSQMSGGEQQRVAIARAIAKNPKLLLCDEPTGALDYQTGKSILGLLRSMCDNYGMTVIVITHNSALAPMADQVIHLKNGKVEKQEYNEHPESIDNIEW